MTLSGDLPDPFEEDFNSLNPSFSGWPSLGQRKAIRGVKKLVLIPLLVDDPLWAIPFVYVTLKTENVLIPLLVDDPLWVLKNNLLTF